MLSVIRDEEEEADECYPMVSGEGEYFGVYLNHHH